MYQPSSGGKTGAAETKLTNQINAINLQKYNITPPKMWKKKLESIFGK